MSDDVPTGFMPPPALATRTFLIADIRGYTRFTREHGDEAASALTAQYAVTVRQAVAGHGCELLELRGDEAMCVFGSARRALDAAVELQRRLRTAQDGVPPLPLGVGVGLDAGEAVPTEDGYRGGALNLAARLCSIAAPGQILASEAVAHLAGRVDGLTFVRRRPASLKGVGNAVSVLEVVPDQPLPPPPPPPPKEPTRSRSPRTRLVGLAVIAAVAAVAVAFWLTRAGSGGQGVALHSNSLVEIDPGSGRVVGDVPLRSAPGEIVSGGGAIWVGRDDGTISRVGPDTLTARVVSSPVPPTSLAVGFGALWIYDATSERVAAIDLNAVTPSAPYQVDTCPYPDVQECITGGIATGEGAIWIGRTYASGAAPAIGTVWKRDPTSFRIQATFTKLPADRLLLAAGSLWTFGNLGRHAAKVDLTTNRRGRVTLPTASPVFDQPEFTYAFGHLWLVNAGTLFECDFNQQCTTATVDSGSHGVAATADSLWVTSNSGTLTKVNPFTRTITHTYRLGHEASGIIVYRGHIWVGIGARIQPG
ncbi:MAG: adenylate cyclase [Gaiellales bacterium]|nr:adenylate cyclase [Gaiellales bacterium]